MDPDTMNDLSDIPMPPESGTASFSESEKATGATTEENEAWKKAQAALKEICPPSSSSSSTNEVVGNQLDSIQAKMMAAYPWMSQYSMGFPTQSVFSRAPTQTPSWVPPVNPYTQQQRGPAISYPPRPSYLSQQQQQAYGSMQKPGNFLNLPPPGVVNNPQLASRGAGNNRGGFRGVGNAPPWRRGSGRGGDFEQRATPYPGGPQRKNAGGTGGNMEPLGGERVRGYGTNANRGRGAGSAAYSGNNDAADNRNNQQAFMSPRRREIPDSSGSATDSPGGGRNSSSGTMPPGVTDYIERAYMAAENEAEKNKVEETLKYKLMPLLQSGDAWNVDWKKEPLPTDPNFEMGGTPGTVGQGWIPQSVAGRKRRGGMFGGQRGGNLAARQGPRGFKAGRNVFADAAAKRGAWGNRRSGRESPSRRRKRRSDDSDSDERSDRSSTMSADRRAGSRSSGAGSRKMPRGGALSGSSGRFRSRRFLDDDARDLSDESESSSTVSSSVTSVSGGPLGGRLGKKLKGPRGKLGQKKAKGQLQFSVPDSGREAEMKAKRAQRFAKHMQSSISATTAPPRGSVKKRIGAAPRVLASRLNRAMYDDFNWDDDGMFLYCSKGESNELDLGAFVIAGTCQDVEKAYLRLTAAPDASQVRPQRVLERSLELVKRKWRENQDYYYACDQLKSIRQDITIQCIRNNFTVQVYETHARIALEKKDNSEFNQCQTQLRSLYKEIKGSPNEYEFTAYRLMYYVYMENSTDLTTSIAELTPEAKEDSCIAFAMGVRKAWALQSYHYLFKYYVDAPRMSSYVMDLFVERERKAGLRRIMKAYRPTIPVSFVTKQLGYLDEAACKEWLKELAVSLDNSNSHIDCRQAVGF